MPKAQQNAEKNTDRVDFGYQDVPRQEKARLVGEVFDSVATRYDLMNDMMSMGIHRLWKRQLAAAANLHEGDKVLDLAGGTGDVAALLLPKVGASGKITIADINASMLSVGRDRLLDRGILHGVEWTQANAESLPFPDASFDCVTIAFGLRNVTDKDAALREMRRVLKVGGRALILEFSKVQGAALRQLYDLYSFQVLPRLGRWIAGDSDSYQYLAESIRKHPDQETLQGMMEDAGFERVSFSNMTGGVVAMHRGYRI